MALKISVENRVSTYPGRVTMTPVSGQANTYDMVRADMPLTEGTPIDKALLDNKAYALTEDVTIYVATDGNDLSGDGSAQSPFATVQKAIDELPRYLDGHIATISIGVGVYPERVEINGFCGGRLVVGQPGEVFTLDGIAITNSSHVETNIYQIEKPSDSSLSPFVVKDGSSVSINSDLILNGNDTNSTGMTVENNSRVVTGNNVKVTVNTCGSVIVAQWCSFVSLSELSGSGNVFGVWATQGSVISYKTDTLEKAWSHSADSGGLVLTGSNSTTLSGATVEL